MKAYLFGSIFYEKDIEYNKILLEGIRKAYPGIDIYAPQEAPFNNKKSFGDSAAIYEGDYNRLKETDLLIGCLDGDLPPIGSVTEAGIFSQMAKTDPNKHMVVLHTDTRDAYKTSSLEKFNDMEQNQCASQFNYFNLFTRGVIESCGVIVGTKEQLFEYVHQLYTEYRRTHHQSGIYLITNRINNKRYIGQAMDIPKRLNSHRWVKTENPQAVDLAIQKYGIENFTFETLEECSIEELNSKEAYWAQEVFNYTTYAPYGYNIGQMSPNGAKYGNPGMIVSSYDLNGNLIKIYPSILEASRELHCNPHAIAQALDNNHRSSQNLLWAQGIASEIQPFEALPHGDAKEVDIYDSTGEFITTCQSLTEASDYLHSGLNTVAVSYHNPGMRANRFYVVPKGDKPLLVLNKRKKAVFAYDKTTRKFVQEYSSAVEAGNQIDCDPSYLGKACKGQCYYCKNYIWSYLKYDIIPANYKEINENYWNEFKFATQDAEEEPLSGEAHNDL